MINISEIKTIEELKRIQDEVRETIRNIKQEARKQRTDVAAIAQTLTPATQSVFDAQKAYEEKGFIVKIEIDEKTGLIRKWKLMNRRPKKQNIGGGIRSEASVKQMKPDEFRQILTRLPDQFSSKDVLNALIGSGIGVRKLQPAFGMILKQTYGDFKVEKVPGVDKGPSVRYRKVN
jgi:hypothetical protein